MTIASDAVLAGRHALVTGGGGGIGAAIARELLTRGARVTIGGRSSDTLAATVAQLSMLGPIDAVQMDVASAASVAHAFAVAQARFGPVAILVNNAGQAASSAILKTADEEWQQMLAVNLTGAWHCMRAALPAMLEEGWGRIVNVASTAGLTGYAYVSAYCAAKHGVVGLTRAVALEVATRGITVNAVCPGYTDTDIVRDAVANIVAKTGRSAQQAIDALASANPQRRLVRPDEVADTVAWLCGQAASAINGQAIAIAGGEVMS